MIAPRRLRRETKSAASPPARSAPPQGDYQRAETVTSPRPGPKETSPPAKTRADEVRRSAAAAPWGAEWVAKRTVPRPMPRSPTPKPTVAKLADLIASLV